MNFKFDNNSFSFSSERVQSGNLAPYAKLYLSKNADAPEYILGGNFTETEKTIVDTYFGKGELTSYESIDASGTHKLKVDFTVLNPDEFSHSILLDATYTNNSDSDVYLESFGFHHKDGDKLVCKGDADNFYLSYRASLKEKLKSYNQIITEMYEHIHMTVPDLPKDEQHTDGRWRLFTEYLTLYPKDELKGFYISPVGDPVGYINHECFVDTDENDEGYIKLNTFCAMSNVRVKPGASRKAQTIIIANAPHDYIVDKIFSNIAKTHGSRSDKGAVVGWCSWYDLYSQITEESVTKTVEAITKYKDIIPMDYIQIDDGFQVTVGDWRTNSKFPGGWDNILKKIEESGAKPGIWMAPVKVHDSTSLFKEHPEWIMKNEKGDFMGACGNWGDTSYAFDMSNPETFEHVINMVKTEYNRGFRYFKFDFNDIQANGRSSFNPDFTSLELYRYVYENYRKAIGEDSYLCACAGFNRGVLGYADSARIGPDSPPDWKTPDLSCITGCIKHVGYTAFINGYFFANDPDVTYLYTTRLTEDELKTWHSMVGICGGVQFISDPLWKKENGESLRRFEILTPPAPEKAVSIHAAIDNDNKRFGFIAKRPYGNFASMMVYSPFDEEAVIDTELYKLAEIGDKFHVWSFWDEEYLGKLNNNFPLKLDKHSCKLMRFTPIDNEKPQLIGSDLHISMGAAEIKDIIYTDTFMEIFFNSNAGARNGSVYIYSDKDVNYISFVGTKNAEVTKKDNIIKITLTERERNVEQSVKLYF